MIQEIEKKRIYVAGPMRGYLGYNFPAFDDARDQLKADGWDVVSPADLDRDEGFDPKDLPQSYDWTRPPEGFDFQACVKRDLNALQDCDAIYLLRGWGDSTGAKAEHAVALWLGLEIHCQL